MPRFIRLFLPSLVILATLAILVVPAMGAVSVTGQPGASAFSASGDVTVTVNEATAEMTRIGGRTPAITIVSAPAAVRALGTSYNVNLFFSEKFEPRPGIFPIEFSYRRVPDTLGASFRQRGATFSHDTKGTAEFIEFGEQVRVRFEFESYDQSQGREGRRRVTVTGEAVCARVDIWGTPRQALTPNSIRSGDWFTAAREGTESPRRWSAALHIDS